MLTYAEVKKEIVSMVIDMSKNVSFNRGTIDATVTQVWAELLKTGCTWPANHRDWITRCLVHWSDPKNRGAKGIDP